MKFKYLWILTFIAGCLATAGIFYFYQYESNKNNQQKDTLWKNDIRGEIINTSDKNYEGDRLESDLNNDGQKEIIFQQLISAGNGVRLIIADQSDKVLYSTLTRAGKIEVKENSVIDTSEDATQTYVTKISWDGKKWIKTYTNGQSPPWY